MYMIDLRPQTVNVEILAVHLSLKGLAKAEELSYIVPGMQVATD